MKKLKIFFASMLVMTGLAMGVAAPFALAQTPVADACGAINAGADCSKGTGPSITSIIKTVVVILSIVVGIIAVIMIIIAGLKYVTSGGDASSVASAKNTLIYALVGLFIAGSAQIIVNYVMANVK